MTARFSLFSSLIAVALLGLPVVVQAASFKELSGQGYKVGALSSNKAGIRGWNLSKGSDRYFCEMRATMAYSGKNGMVSFTSAGRMISLDRNTVAKGLGGSLDLPKYEDLKAGRLRADDVGSCRKVT
ncbi:hypothetical protein EN41_09225 [Agrobacterium tumefaciens]|uniref:Uncharacterized protein n=1 Tax=Agrobacterium fabrum (strain C58 / ATCC 33970) TaxID=176299 RepID=A9CI94_AGRFC|nr:hypothetical protein [Agrobacterium fabrum]KEY56251.1 hypothetical protein EN41_09225 [Agrobacterium tumefaciens]AAK87884.1 hypothetical protein Atu2137 [Agrobacterium fabrum str. C58]KJX87878.1 hypothetical protein SY94_1996 [Agrobacterium tumefaciens]MCX2877430.1 hypothetical protein [Agrobacterium fabrum]NMV72848.1 hypothetical protein [Agrobacterium fabrum]